MNANDTDNDDKHHDNADDVVDDDDDNGDDDDIDDDDDDICCQSIVVVSAMHLSLVSFENCRALNIEDSESNQTPFFLQKVSNACELITYIYI